METAIARAATLPRSRISDRLRARPSAPWFRRLPVAGLAITECRLDDVRAMVRSAMAERCDPTMVGTVNLNFLRWSFERHDLRRVLQDCHYLFADGWPVLHLARRRGYRFLERVTGSDLTPRLCRWAAEEGWRMAFVGGNPRVRGRLEQRVREHFKAPFCGHWQPWYRSNRAEDVRDPALAAEIRATRPDVLLVALGCPKQEHWLAQNLAGTGAALGMGVGTSFDFIAGTVPRAPRALQLLRLEFLWRALQDPRRMLERYRRDGAFLLRLMAREYGRQR